MPPVHAHPVDDRALSCASLPLALLDHVAGPAGRFVVPRFGSRLDWDHHAFHATAYQADPELYALSALATDTTDAHRLQVLFQVLRASRAGLGDAARTINRVVAVLLAGLGDDDVLQVFLALRRVRVNRKHATRALTGWLFGHPALGELVARRRPAVRDVLDHVLGKSASRASLRAIVSGEPAIRLGRLGLDPTATAPVAAWLLRRGPAPVVAGVPVARRTLSVAQDPRPQTVTVTNRGPISAALVHAWRGVATEVLHAELARAVAARTEGLPRFEGRLAVVLDLSASMAGYGDREHAASSQAVALWLCLAACVPDLHVVPVGGHLPAGVSATAVRTSGSTDLARGLLAAARTAPDVIVIVTDGYESVRAGDLAAVAAALPRAGVSAPVVFCNVLFSGADDLSDRQPAPALPELRVWHEDDFDALFLRLLARAPGAVGRRYLRDALLSRLARLEEV